MALKKSLFYTKILTKLGTLYVLQRGNFIVEVIFARNSCQLLKKISTKEKPKFKSDSALLKKAKKQIILFLSGKLKKFELPIVLQGTKFQKHCWQTLKKIPYGKTLTYQQLATLVKSPGSARAVGTALSKNPIPIILPCHRVVRSYKGLGGYLAGTRIKNYLLKMEKFSINS